jgi:hypothetical protein
LKTEVDYFSGKAGRVVPNSAKYLFGHVFCHNQIISTYFIAGFASALTSGCVESGGDLPSASSLLSK